MREVVSVINLCVDDKQNTHRVTSKTEVMVHAQAAHIIILIDSVTPMLRAIKARDAFIDAGALSAKIVDSEFKQQYMVTYQEWTQ